MENNGTAVREIVDRLFSLYENRGHEEYGEGVTQLMHMTQCALLAEREGCEDEMVLAAFFHDIGHFLEGTDDMGIYGKQDHDRLGGELLLQSGFPERMATLVAGHVTAKRYLTLKEPGYYDRLSDASKKTLEFQGGPMSEKEARDFESDPMMEACLKIRYWDDEGKETGVPVKTEDIERLRQMAVRYLLKLKEN